jgi:hypothetical protein
MVYSASNNNNDYWQNFIIFAQNKISSTGAEERVQDSVQNIFQNIKTMKGSISDLLKLKQSLFSALSDHNIDETNKKLLASKILEAIKEKKVESNAQNILSEIQSYLTFYFEPNKKAKRAHDEELIHLAQEVSTISLPENSIEFTPISFLFDGEKGLQELEIPVDLTKKFIENSLYVKAIWTSNFKEKQQKKIILKNFDIDAFHLLIRNLYNENPLSLNEALDLLGIADFFQVSSVKKRCYIAIKNFTKNFSKFTENSDLETFISIYKNYRYIPEISNLITNEVNNYDNILRYINKCNESFIEFLNSIPLIKCKLDNAKDDDFKNVKKLTQLKELILNEHPKYSKITGKIVENFPQSLEKLDLSICAPSEKELNFLKENCPNLKEIKFSARTLQNFTGLANISSSIRKIHIEKCPWDSSVDETFKLFSQLEELVLKYYYGDSLLFLPTTLKCLDLHFCRLTDSIMIFLKNLTSLEEISIVGGDKLSGEFLIHLSKTIKKITFMGCDKFLEEHLLLIKEQINLEELSIFDQGEFSGNFLNHLSNTVKKIKLSCLSLKGLIEHEVSFKKYSNLESITLFTRENIKGFVLSSFPEALREINISGEQLTDDDLKFLCKFSKLEKLTIEPVGKNISGQFLTSLSNTLTLTKIELCHSDYINGKNLVYLPDTLKEINLLYCYTLTDNDLVFLHKFSKLENLILWECRGISNEFFRSISLAMETRNL